LHPDEETNGRRRILKRPNWGPIVACGAQRLGQMTLGSFILVAVSLLEVTLGEVSESVRHVSIHGAIGLDQAPARQFKALLGLGALLTIITHGHFLSQSNAPRGVLVAGTIEETVGSLNRKWLVRWNPNLPACGLVGAEELVRNTAKRNAAR
jgi:hypothetical protein